MKIIKQLYAVLHTKLYYFLRKHPALDALQFLLRNRKNRETCLQIAKRDGMIWKCREFGPENKDKNLYFIKYGKESSGFFVMYRMLLKYLCVAERFGFCPVVQWDSSIPYAEEKMIYGTKNPFEYYFEQPAGISIEEAYKSYNVFDAEDIHLEDCFLNREIPDGEQGYIMSEEFMDRLAKAAHKYMKLNEMTEKYMKEQIDSILKQKNYLGVHYRGSDYKRNYTNHPISVELEEYIETVKKIFEKMDYDGIFLATDDITGIKEFKRAFGEQVTYYEDVQRTDTDISVAFSEKKRPYHNYLLGREVLRDMLTLAKCNGLIAGVSQVSICAQITKKSNHQKYDDLIIMNKGINKNNNVFVV